MINSLELPAEVLRSENAQLLSDLEQTRAALLDVETRLHLVSQAIMSVVIDWDLSTGQFFRLNSAENVMGYSPDELAQSLDEFRSGVHPDDLPGFDKSLEQWLASRELELLIEFRCMHKDGIYRMLQVHAFVVREPESGKALRVVASYRDITSERKALHALQQSEDRYRQAMEAIQGIVFDWDTVNGTVYRSSGVTRMLGYPMEEVLPVPQWWQSLIHPDDLIGTMTAVNGLIEQGPSNGSIEYRIRHKQGHYLLVNSTFMAVRNDDGRAIRIVGCIVDLTQRILAEEARRQAERNYDQLFHDMPLGLVVVTPQGKLIECNKAYADMMHASVQESLVGDSENRSFWAELYAQTQKRQHEYEGKRNLARKDGSALFVHVRAKLITYQTQSEPCLLVILEDQTAQQQSDQKKQQLEQHLQETQKLESLGVLAGGIAHDFNNLLTVILGNLSLVRQDLGQNNPHYLSLDQAEQASIQAAELCRQMLAYAGRGQLDNRPFNLSELVEQSRALLHSAAGKHHHLHFHLSSGLPFMAGDPSQIKQVLLNLVQNAAEAITTQWGTVDVLTGVGKLNEEELKKCMFVNQHASADYLWLEVRDNGQGMDLETRQRIFEPFFTTKFTGRGLGLAAVAGIVRNHRGLILCLSQPQRGTSFRVYFPIDVSASSRIITSKPVTDESRQVVRSQGTILVVDDEPTVRMVLARLLAKRGFAVIEAENGNEALEMIARYNDALLLVILDLTMPQRDGLSALQEMRSNGNRTPVVVISGYYSSELIPQLDQLQAKFISKPFSAQGLLAVIDPILAVK